MNNLIQSLIAILRERHKPWCISFKAENSSQDSNFGITLTVIKQPETDAILIYEGTGSNFDDAMETLVRNVISDFPKENAWLGNAKVEH